MGSDRKGNVLRLIAEVEFRDEAVGGAIMAGLDVCIRIVLPTPAWWRGCRRVASRVKWVAR